MKHVSLPAVICALLLTVGCDSGEPPGEPPGRPDNLGTPLPGKPSSSITDVLWSTDSQEVIYNEESEGLKGVALPVGDSGSPRTLVGRERGPRDPALSEDGSVVYYTAYADSKDGVARMTLYASPVEGGAEEVVAEGLGPVGYVGTNYAVSRSGRYVAVTLPDADGSHPLYVLDRETGDLTFVTDSERGRDTPDLGPIAFSPDEREIIGWGSAYSGSAGYYRVEWREGVAQRVFLEQSIWSAAAAVRWDGEGIRAAYYEDSTFVVENVTTGSEVRFPLRHDVSWGQRPAAWSPDGGAVALWDGPTSTVICCGNVDRTVEGEEAVRVAFLDTGEVRDVMWWVLDGGSRSGPLAFARDGKSVVRAYNGGHGRGLYVADLE